MHGKWTLGAIALVVVASTAIAATAVFGGESAARDRPGPTSVDVTVSAPSAAAAPHRARAAKPKPRRPRVIYLHGPPTTIDVAQTGPNIDVRLLKCPDRSRVIDGGVFPGDPNVIQQGSHVPTRREYHVLLGFRDPAAAQSFTISSHLICLKGVR